MRLSIKYSALISLPLIALISLFFYAPLDDAGQLKLAHITVKPNHPITPFSLKSDIPGGVFSEHSLKGVWSFLFFSYTQSAEISTDSLLALDRMWRILHDKSQIGDLQFVFVSIDPTRDTSDVLNNYVSLFNNRFLWATGNEHELKKLTHQLGLHYSIDPGTPNDPTNYEIKQTVGIWVINPKGEYHALLSPPFNPFDMADAVISMRE